MPGRHAVEGKAYRYGFNGMEKDDEIKGDGNSYTAQFWEYDSRIARRWNRDPISRSSQSPYTCFNDNPIVFADPSGLIGTPRQHTTKKGDTYSSLAKKYNTSVDNLRKWNNYKDKEIPVGVQINVSDPGKDLFVGSTGKVGDGEDAQFHFNLLPPTERAQELVKNDMDEGIRENMKDFEECNSLFIINELRDDWETIKRAFFSRNGGQVSGLKSIERSMRRSSVGIALDKKINEYFKEQMKINGGNYSMIDFSTSGIRPPSYSGVSPSLLSLVGGTQQLDVYISSITIHGRAYTATLTYWLFDDYGVSAGDFMKADVITKRGMAGMVSGCREGLVAMWILQHRFGFKPLQPAYKFNTTINGSF